MTENKVITPVTEQEDMRSVLEARLFKHLNAGKMTDFCILKCVAEKQEQLPPTMKLDDGKAYVTIMGSNLPVLENVSVRFYGKWVKSKNPKYKDLTFRAESWELLNPKTKNGMIAFLSGKIFPGVGKKTAESIYDLFGMNSLDELMEGNGWLKVKGITPEKLGACRDSYSRNKIYGTMVMELAPFGIGPASVAKLIEKYGDDVKTVIQKDPYRITEIKGIGFKQADAIARGYGVKLDSKKRVEYCGADVVRKACSTGNMYMDYGSFHAKLFEQLTADLGPEDVFNCETAETQLKDILSHPKDTGRLIIGMRDIMDPNAKGITCVYPASYNTDERDSARKLVELLKKPITGNKVTEVRAALDEYLKNSDKKLSEKQQAAVVRSLSSRVSIITGGPGTGKTTIVSAILYCYEKVFGGEETLMAPTGRAAGRMAESTGRKTSTIHSRLKLYEVNGKPAEPQPINSGLVIVDEVSMVDNRLLMQLLNAIDTANCHVIFVGDIDQLPSVGPGACLGEMIKSEVIPTSRLTEIFRQKGNGGAIIENAARVNHGNGDLEWDKNSFMFAPAASEDEAVKRVLDAYKWASTQYGSHEVALLSPLRKARAGHTCVADALNSVIQAEVNPAVAGKAECQLNGTTYRVGDRVMQWQNCETSANGDVGDIISIKLNRDGDITVKIKWDDGDTFEYDAVDMETIKLAYAISIHKSQGSEYACVIIPMLTCQDNMLFKRNLLYTGITRAKQTVVIIGDKNSIKQTSAKCETGKRNTLLSSRIRYEYKKAVDSGIIQPIATI